MRYFTWKLELASNILWTVVDASLYDYSDTCILGKERVIAIGQGADGAAIAADRNH